MGDGWSKIDSMQGRVADLDSARGENGCHAAGAQFGARSVAFGFVAAFGEGLVGKERADGVAAS